MMKLMFFQFHDILLKLAEDVRILRLNDGEIITFIADTITDIHANIRKSMQKC